MLTKSKFNLDPVGICDCTARYCACKAEVMSPDRIAWIVIQVDRYRAGIARMDFDAGLAPYNVNVYPAWKSLTQHISAQTIDR